MSILRNSWIAIAGVSLSLLGTGSAAQAIVTPTDPDNYLVPSDEFSGVARLELGESISCSGSLLSGGLHILTAAHCLTDNEGIPIRNVLDNSSAVFNIEQGSPSIRLPIAISDFFIHPNWSGTGGGGEGFVRGNDIAVLQLAEPAPAFIEQYDLYRNTDEVGQIFTKVGYGNIGLGNTGYIPNSIDGRKRFGQNRFDALVDLFKEEEVTLTHFDVATSEVSEVFNWADIAISGSQLLLDFDNGLPENDAFGVHFGIEDLGLGDTEVNPAPGDSGGPSFLLGDDGNWLIAGVSSHIFVDSSARVYEENFFETDEKGNPVVYQDYFPDDPTTSVTTDFVPGVGEVGINDSSFGGFGSVTRVSNYASFVDDAVAGKVPSAVAVPEPPSILGTLAFSALGAGGLLKRRNKHRSAKN
ncbi:MAG: trypsin-like serine protease [Coleofasciculus sp.]